MQCHPPPALGPLLGPGPEGQRLVSWGPYKALPITVAIEGPKQIRAAAGRLVCLSRRVIADINESLARTNSDQLHRNQATRSRIRTKAVPELFYLGAEAAELQDLQLCRACRGSYRLLWAVGHFFDPFPAFFSPRAAA